MINYLKFPLSIEFIQAGTSQSHHQQPSHPVEYKSGMQYKFNLPFKSTNLTRKPFKIFTEDEIWVEKAIDIASNSGQQSDESPKSTKSSKNNSSSYKANCLTPR